MLRGIVHLSLLGLKPLLPKKKDLSEGLQLQEGIENKEVLKVELQNAKLQTNRIIEYKGEIPKAFEFRPQTWGQFIGQEKAKELAQMIKKEAFKGIPCHFLVDGIQGHGKTTFVELFAKGIGAKLIQRVGKQIDEEDIINIINEINTSKERFVVFFIDEMDTMDWKLIKILNPIIEQFKISGKKIKPFIFAGATINKHILKDKNPDTLDRIGHHIKFARYNAEEISTIINQYRQELYPDEVVPDEVIKVISLNCKFNPRTSIALLRMFLVRNNINKVLEDNRIIIDGLTDIDIKLLDILNTSTRAMGVNSLAMKARLKPKEYETEFEPFLVEYEYINRVPSRVIAPKGKELLTQLQGAKQ
jgi:Holliday junction resolvasome RuvABC ATP-dependent DNA helicase subunit